MCSIVNMCQCAYLPLCVLESESKSACVPAIRYPAVCVTVCVRERVRVTVPSTLCVRLTEGERERACPPTNIAPRTCNLLHVRERATNCNAKVYFAHARFSNYLFFK